MLESQFFSRKRVRVRALLVPLSSSLAGDIHAFEGHDVHVVYGLWRSAFVLFLMRSRSASRRRTQTSCEADILALKEGAIRSEQSWTAKLAQKARHVNMKARTAL